MFEKTKKKISNYILKKKFYHNIKQLKFENLVKESKNILIILPDNEALEDSLEVIKYFNSKGKYVTIIIRDNRATEVLSKFRVNCIPYGQKSKNLFGLPKGEVVNSLKGNHYDIVCDLTPEPNEFTAALANYADSGFKIGFYNKELCIYYNFVLKNSEQESDEFYKFLIKSIDNL